MRHAPRRLAAAFLPLVGLALAPATASQAAPVPPTNPAASAENVRDDYTGHVQVVRGQAAGSRVTL